MVVRALPVVESAPVSGQAPLVRKEAAPVASGQCHDESEDHEHSAECGQPIPASMIHDETPKVPVKSFRDDIKRKVALKKVMGKHEPPDDKKQGPVTQSEVVVFANPPGPIPKPFKKNSKDEVVNDYAPTRRYKTTEAVPSSFNDDPAGMDDTSDLDLGMLDPDNNEEIPTGDDQLWTKEEVNYRYSGDKFESCGNCVHFKFPGACDIISGAIRAVDVCDKFEANDEDKGETFGWENPVASEDEDAHSVNDQTVPSTLVPLKDKDETVPSHIIGGGYGGFGKSYGMITAESDRGKDSFGSRGMKNDDVVKSKRPSFGPASSWGMVTDEEEGGPGSGRHQEPAGVKVNGQMNDMHGNPHTLFTDKITGSTMMLPSQKATPENMHNKAVAKRRTFYGDPTERRQAMKKSFGASESAAIKALANRLAESAFDVLKNKLAHKKGITSPGGLAATIGRKKYGKAGMAKKAAAGRRKTTEAPGEFMKVGPGPDAGDASGKMAYEPTQRNKKFKGMRDSGKSIAPTT